MIIGMLGLMLLGMGASTVYFVSAGAQPEGRLSEIQAQLDEQTAKAKEVAETISAKDSQLRQLERQLQLAAAKPAPAPGGSPKDRMELENKITALEAQLSASKTKLVKAENELSHVLEQFRDVEKNLKARADTAEQKAGTVDQRIAAEKTRADKAVAAEHQAQQALREAAIQMEKLRAELAALKTAGVAASSSSSPIRTAPRPVVTAQPEPEEPAVAEAPSPPPIPAPATTSITAVGQVATVDLKLGIIICAMTSVDGIRIGDSLIVTRGGEYAGMVLVSRIDAQNNAVIAELDALKLPKGVLAGDQVTIKK